MNACYSYLSNKKIKMKKKNDENQDAISMKSQVYYIDSWMKKKLNPS